MSVLIAVEGAGAEKSNKSATGAGAETGGLAGAGLGAGGAALCSGATANEADGGCDTGTATATF